MKTGSSRFQQRITWAGNSRTAKVVILFERTSDGELGWYRELTSFVPIDWDEWRLF
ncbi:hypothetical protein OKN36_07560 [Furfurilactobacillus sp. OKN36]